MTTCKTCLRGETAAIIIFAGFAFMYFALPMINKQRLFTMDDKQNAEISTDNDTLGDKISNKLVGLINPLLSKLNGHSSYIPPERNYVMNDGTILSNATAGLPININSQGGIPDYQHVGFAFNDTNVRLPLYGRQTYYGSNKWEYYVIDDTRNHVKIDVENPKDNELYDDDVITINAGFENSQFNVKLYEYNAPKYIPYVY